MSRVLTISILVTFLFNSLGYYIVFELNKYLVKKEMQSVLRSGTSPVTILEVPDPDTNPDFSRPDDNEILYQGKLFDVIKEIKKSKTSYFYCKHDVREEMLIAGFKRMVKSKLNQLLLDHVVKMALKESSLILNPYFSMKVNYPDLIVAIIPIYIPPFSPPPES